MTIYTLSPSGRLRTGSNSFCKSNPTSNPANVLPQQGQLLQWRFAYHRLIIQDHIGNRIEIQLKQKFHIWDSVVNLL